MYCNNIIWYIVPIHCKIFKVKYYYIPCLQFNILLINETLKALSALDMNHLFLYFSYIPNSAVTYRWEFNYYYYYYHHHTYAMS